MERTRLRSAMLFLALGVAASGLRADEAHVLQEFNRFDRDGSGYLSKAEMAACGCASFDRNEDQILMPAEYLAGRRAGPGSSSASPAPPGPAGRVTSASAPSARARVSVSPPTPRAGSAGGWAAGDRVKAGCYGNMKEGGIDRLEGNRAWVRFSDEPNCDGFRDVDSLRPPSNARRTQAGGGAPPSGTYVCQKLSGSSLIGLGHLEIRGSTYSGLGAGSSAPFSVGGSGDITLTKGLRGLPDGWTVSSTRYAGLDEMGRPLIRIGYRTSRGSTDQIDCIRE